MIHANRMMTFIALVMMSMPAFASETKAPANVPPIPPSVQIWESFGVKSKLKALTAKPVEVAGFTIVNEFEGGEVSEFMLTKYPGGCVHVPLPPASSIIHVVMKEGKTTPSFFGKRVIVHGTLKEGGRIDAGFEMTADSVQEFPL